MLAPGHGAVTAVFAPGMIWRIEGHSAASKEYSITFNDLWARVQPG